MKLDVEPSIFAPIRGPVLALALGWALPGCGDGVGRPLVPVPEGEGSEGGTGNSPLPAYCDAVASWPDESAQAEETLFTLIGVLRQNVDGRLSALAAGCIDGGFDSAPPLLMNWELRCAARLHSLDMHERGYFDHYTLDGVGPQARIELTGYQASVYGESIARGRIEPGLAEDSTPFEELLGPGPECQNLFDAKFNAVGIGYHEGLWTLDFAGR
jgi:hypothetical protein